MARRYDANVTTFSPEGRLHQVEYAVEAINNAGTAVGLLATDGVVMAGEKQKVTKLLEPPKSSEKIYKLDDHAATVVAGLTADANILINAARVAAGRYKYQYGEPMPVEQLVSKVCDHKQLYTQYGGQRPFGVKFLFAGYDSHHGYQLYLSDPSGNYSGWRATCMGQNANSGQGVLKAEYEETMDSDACVKLALKVLNKTMESLSAENIDLFALKRKDDGTMIHEVYANDVVAALLEEVKAEQEAADAEKERLASGGPAAK
jgi:20S proteasome subunit alpha 3|uniref:Proteasome subunit alpha type n=1 Tax=Pelagomonas calceolata TaxID=35677 RepID=A0A6S8Z027_9STRA|mmetsp:Transcript_4584/g.13093  ORF Transcript_4584/g.13093 Transcript_4584/m.13093 type:complete len:261 (-) Transcript_4584:45-827(-)